MPRTVRKQGSRRLGRTLFVIPVLLVIGIVAFGLVSAWLNSTGTLVVEAQSSYGGVTSPLLAVATVSTTTGHTPYNVTLNPGSFTVTYSQLEWYHTPPPTAVVVLGGKTAYSIGIYTPIASVISVTSVGFNSSRSTAKHGVTPVVWIDASTKAVQIESGSFNAVIAPGQNYTRIFQAASNMTVTLLGTGSKMTVNVI